MRIGELARRTAVEAGTLRAWERRFGLLQPTRTKGGQRQYSEADVSRVLTVRRLIDEGLTLTAAAERVVEAGEGAPPSEPDSRLLQQILQSLDEGILVGKDARARYANRRAAQILGCSVDELLARSILDFIVEEDRQKARSRVADLRQGVVPDPFDQRLRRPDGATLTIEARVRPMFDRAGKYEGSVSIMRDVTEQRAAEAQDRFRVALLDAVGEALIAGSADGTITYVNHAAEVLFGWPADEAIGRALDDFPGAPDTRSQRKELRARVAAGQLASGRITMARRDGSTFPALYTATPVFDPDGRVQGGINVIRDLTESDEAADELRIGKLRGSAIAVLGARALSKGSDSASSDEVLLRDTVEATRRLLDADRAAYLEVNADGSLSPRTSVSEVTVPLLPAGTGSLAGFTVLARRVVVVDDIARERRFNVDAFTPGTRSAIAAPVFGPFGVRGVLSAGRGPTGSFDDAAADFVQSMANVIGAALS
jgi:PAS domain S-box-containing protein